MRTTACSAELFPTKLSFVVFILYMALFINQGLLVTASKNADNSYNYNITTVVLLTEVLKLVISLIAYCKDHTVSKLLQEINENKKVFLLYFIPAFLYCLYNNLAFVNLAVFDPTTYYLLLQFRVVMTGLVFQFLFKKKLSGIQWVSMLFLTAGCIIKQMNFSLTGSSTNEVSTVTQSAEKSSSLGLFHFSFSIAVILFQCMCSVFAGVYNEYLLKQTGCEVHIMIQNVFMYIDSIISNVGVLMFQGNLMNAISTEALQSVLKYNVVFIMINNAGIGIVTSFFLKNLNSILKAFASALELMFTAVLAYLIFGIPIYLNTVIAIAIVSYATIMYSKNPVVNKPRNEIEVPLSEIEKDAPVSSSSNDRMQKLEEGAIKNQGRKENDII